MSASRTLMLCLLVVLLSGIGLPALAARSDAGAAVFRAPRYDVEAEVDASTADRRAARPAIAAYLDRVSALVGGEPITSAQARQQRASWTVMVYLAADNDLEEYALGDMDEMEVIGSTSAVNIIVQLDRATGYDSSDGNWAETRRYFVTRDSNRRGITSELVQSLGETNTGDPAVLADFATWTMRTYPADHYALIVWDHGGSWLGIASDASADDDDLSLTEIDRALSQIVAANNGVPLDIIGFDACLMGEYEVYHTIAPYADYGIAAEETIPGYGWDYAGPFDALVRNPAMDGLAFSRAFVDSYMTFYTETVTYYDVFDLGVMDLSHSEAVYASLDTFANTVAAHAGAVLSAIGDARNNTIVFGGFDDPQYFDLWSAADLIQFMDIMTTLTPDRAVAQAAQQVVASASQMVAHHRANEGLRGARGMSIFFPRNLRSYNQYGFSGRYAQESPDGMVAWRQFLDVFYGMAIETVTEAPQVSILGAYPEVASIYQPSTIQMEISGRDIVDVTLGVSQLQEDGTSFLVDYVRLVSRTTTPDGQELSEWPDGTATRSFIWDTEIPLITDGTVEVPAVLIQNRENPISAVVDGRVIPANGDPVDAQLVYDLRVGTVSSVWGVRETANGFVPFELAIQPGDRFQPYWLFLDADHALSARPADSMLTFSTVPFSYRLVPAPTGTYELSVITENITGATTLDRTIIQVNNDGLDTGQRGFTDLEFGVSFRYPANWIEPRYVQTDEGGRLFTGDPVTETLLSVLVYDGAASAQDVAQQVINSWNTLQDAQLVDQQPSTVSGYEAYIVNYLYTLNNQPRAGTVLTVYLPERGLGYGFDLDARASELETAEAVFGILADSIHFFDVAATLGTSSWTTVEAGGGLVSFSVPVSWSPTQAAPWNIYHPEGDTSTFMAVKVDVAQGLSNETLAEQTFDLLGANTNVSNLQTLAAQPYFIGNETWYMISFSYTNTSTGVHTDGAFFVTTAGRQEYVFWLEAPTAVFDQAWEDTFSVIINSFTFSG